MDIKDFDLTGQFVKVPKLSARLQTFKSKSIRTLRRRENIDLRHVD